MNRHEAKQLLDQHLAELRRLSYHELENRIRERRTHAAEIAAPSGRKYQLEEDVRWDDSSKGNIRVIVSIDDGGFLGSLRPLTGSFIKAANDS